jgi:membrane-associated phospholipid phosphatase
LGCLPRGHRDHMGDVERIRGQPASVWPWRSKSRGRAAGPGAVSRVRRDLIVLAASLAVFAGCAVIVANGRVGPAERAVFHAVNGLPGWLYQPMLYAQYLGVLAMPLVVAAGALVWRRWRLAAALVLVVPCKLGLEQVAKLLVQRQRPGTTVPDAILRGVPHGGLSFTSGHAIITFAIAGLLVLVLPRGWGMLAIVLATCNAVARVYLGAHNPLDVVGGAAIGLAIAAVLDLILDVARDHGAARQGSAPRRGRIGPPVGVNRGKS